MLGFSCLALPKNMPIFNHIYKYSNVLSIDLQTGEQTYKYIVDSYYDGHVDEKLGTDTIYEWILNDKTNAIKFIITSPKYRPLLFNILYKQKF